MGPTRSFFNGTLLGAAVATKKAQTEAVQAKKPEAKAAAGPAFEQPEVNIGLIGHVDHGKTTLTKALSGKWTDEHSEEIKRGISIKLGYADTTFYKGQDKEGHALFTTKVDDPRLAGPATKLRRVSFVDAPGHETLMATMLSGAALMDGALLLVAANEKCPQPQTKEHLMALQIAGAKNIVIVQNKIDLVDEKRALENYKEIKAFVKGTVAEDAPVIPISAHHDVNLSALIEAIEATIPTPTHDPKADPVLLVARSFDINKPGTRPDKLRGGVMGGSLSRGTLRVGDEIEVVPGLRIEAPDGKSTYKPLKSKIISLFCGTQAVERAGPGGLIAVGTELDPSVTKADNLVGRALGIPGKLPKSIDRMTMQVTLLERVVGAEDEAAVEPIKVKEPLMLNVGTATTVGMVLKSANNLVEAALKLPVAVEAGDRVAISRRVGGRWRLIGYGILK
ncbi:MAG: translation initiation factor 2 subunit 3 [Thermoplasmata archaeon]|jgi:translation initiation factor 2 subunit 3|nr:translation initiation factor 2 subunit 3 [Thermoplasmata archaeon]